MIEELYCHERAYDERNITEKQTSRPFQVKEKVSEKLPLAVIAMGLFYQPRDVMAHSVRVKGCICILPLSETSRTLDWNRSI